MNLLTKRLLAFLLDYAILLGYMAVLSGFTLLVFMFLDQEAANPNPEVAQAVGFFTLTIPVFLYFYLSERGKHHGTIGKRTLGIRVSNASEDFSGNLLLRNILKFLPWEIAHTGVHWMYYYTHRELDPAGWLWTLLVAPQVIALLYVISILFSNGKASIYDKVAGTRVVANPS